MSTVVTNPASQDPTCTCKLPPPYHTISQHNGIVKFGAVALPAPPVPVAPQPAAVPILTNASSLASVFGIGVNVLFEGQPVSWADKFIPDPSIIQWIREWDEQTNMPLHGTQQEKNLLACLTKMPHQYHFVQLGTNTKGNGVYSKQQLEAVIRNLIDINKRYPNLKAVSLANEPNGSAPIGVDALGALYADAWHLIHDAKSPLLLFGPSAQGEAAAIEADAAHPNLGQRSFFGRFLAAYHQYIHFADHHIYHMGTQNIYNDVFNWVKAINAIAKRYSLNVVHGEGQPTGISATAQRVTDVNIAKGYMDQYFKAIHDAGSKLFFWWAFDNTDMPMTLINSQRNGLTPIGQAFMDFAKHYNVG